MPGMNPVSLVRSFIDTQELNTFSESDGISNLMLDEFSDNKYNSKTFSNKTFLNNNYINNFCSTYTQRYNKTNENESLYLTESYNNTYNNNNNIDNDIYYF